MNIGVTALSVHHQAQKDLAKWSGVGGTKSKHTLFDPYTLVLGSNHPNSQMSKQAHRTQVTAEPLAPPGQATPTRG